MACVCAASETSMLTNPTLDILRAHAKDRGIIKRLCDGTVRHGFRMLSRQSKATAGVRHLRLDAWYFIRRVSDRDVLAVLREDERDMRPLVREAMGKQYMYHVVVKGNDARFMPPGDYAGTDIVATYILERMQVFYDHVDKYLFEELDDASAIKEAMDNPSFVSMLQSYYNSGGQQEEKLKIIARLRGGNNLLHTCIKENYVETLRLLLECYTRETQESTPWCILAEPLRPCGKYGISAFHRAVFDGHVSCLTELIRWASKHDHDIVGLRSIEERSVTGEPLIQLTCLQLAEQEKNYECYNALAEVFGVSKHGSCMNHQTREVRHAVQPRVEVLKVVPGRAGPEEVLASEEIRGSSWTEVLDRTRIVKEAAALATSNEEAGVRIKICQVAFGQDANALIAAELFSLAEGCDMLEMSGCMVHSDLTNLALLRELVERLRASSIFLPRLPTKVNTASPASEPLPKQEEERCDQEVATLLEQMVPLMSQRPKFLGAHNGSINSAQRERLRKLSAGNGFAASWAAVYATRVAALVTHFEDSDDATEVWLRQRSLLKPALVVFEIFYSSDALLHHQYSDPRDAIDPRVANFIELTLTAWFSLANDEDDAWKKWGARLGTDEHTMISHVAPALDLMLEAILRMHDVLDHAWKKHPLQSSVAETVRRIVPAALWHRLPYASELSQKMKSESVKHTSMTAQVDRVSLMFSAPRSLRPSWVKS